MIAGHFATALVAKQQAPKGHLAFYLVISQLPDLLWHLFHFLGVEPTTPANPMNASLQTMHAQMTYSHDLLPTLGWAMIAMMFGRGLFSSWGPGLAAGVLVIVHALCDALSGYPHNLFGPESHQVGLGLYQNAPFVALALEGVFTAAVMGWVFWSDKRAGVRRSRTTLVVWAMVLGGGIVMMVPTATQSTSELLGAAPLEALSGTLVPMLVVTYLGMMAALVWADVQPTRLLQEASLQDESL